MTYQATGYIRDYDAPSDTATVELIGLGIIDTWLDGCRINAGVNRGYLTHGAEALLSIPDAHRLCEATIVSINGSGAVLANSGGVQKTQTGRVRIGTDGAGAGSITVTFPVAFTVIPQLYAGADDLLPLHIFTPTLTNFALSFSAGTAPPNSNIYCTWFAFGGA
jgi:hypothetical protein